MKRFAVAVAVACAGLPVAGVGTAGATPPLLCAHLVNAIQHVDGQALPIQSPLNPCSFVSD